MDRLYLVSVISAREKKTELLPLIMILTLFLSGINLAFIYL